MCAKNDSFLEYAFTFAGSAGSTDLYSTYIFPTKATYRPNSIHVKSALPTYLDLNTRIFFRLSNGISMPKLVLKDCFEGCFE